MPGNLGYKWFFRCTYIFVLPDIFNFEISFSQINFPAGKIICNFLGLPVKCDIPI